jgi:transcriptional regulator with XRE-family HTH domain
MTALPDTTVGASEQQWLGLIGRRLKAARILAGLTQDELSARAKVSRVTIGSVERADHVAGLFTYARLASAVGTTSGELLADYPGPH